MSGKSHDVYVRLSKTHRDDCIAIYIEYADGDASYSEGFGILDPDDLNGNTIHTTSAVDAVAEAIKHLVGRS